MFMYRNAHQDINLDILELFNQWFARRYTQVYDFLVCHDIYPLLSLRVIEWKFMGYIIGTR